MTTTFVHKVECSCGHSRIYSDEKVAQDVFKAHSQNWDDRRCKGVEMNAMLVERGDGYDITATLPQEKYD